MLSAPPYCWTEDLAIGHAPLDEAHRQLFAILGRLQNALLCSANPLPISEALVDLFEHCAEHFRHEEELMQRHQHPHTEAHRAEHDLLLASVQRLHHRFTDGEIAWLTELRQFLDDMLIPHIRNADALIRF